MEYGTRASAQPCRANSVHRPCLLLIALALAAGLAHAPVSAQPAAEGIAGAKPQLQQPPESFKFAAETIVRQNEALLLFQRLADLAEVDVVRYTGPPPHVVKNPTAPGARNPLIIPAYSFLPKKYWPRTKVPLIVFVHGGVHGNMSSQYVHVLRELLEQGYAIIAPEYRGSSGYGKAFWEQIDYGGLEVDDVYAGRQWMLDNHAQVDPRRVGIMGWSHGGLITLMNLFAHPGDFQAGYAGVPVCDLVARMGYKDAAYRELFSARYHIGKTVGEDVDEYRRRSPVWHAAKLATPLLVHTATNDEDVHVLEVENLIAALRAAGKPFEHKIYRDPPGGHAFNRLDTKLAQESRAEVYRFLAKHLSPPNPQSRRD